jgi:hypothetical protein
VPSNSKTGLAYFPTLPWGTGLVGLGAVVTSFDELALPVWEIGLASFLASVLMVVNNHYKLSIKHE